MALTATGDKCPINDLPNEILAHIFLLGAISRPIELIDDPDVESPLPTLVPPHSHIHNSNHSISTAIKQNEDLIIEEDDGDPDYETESDSDSDSDSDEDTGPLFQVLVSHVCRHWRQIALDIPHLWSTLSFNLAPPIDQEREWLLRSKNAPLVIEIDADNIEDAIRMENPDIYPDPADLDMDDMNLNDFGIHNDAKHQLSRLTIKALSQILSFVLPHVSRWKIFSFTSSEYAYIQVALGKVSMAESAPLLQAFNIFDYRDLDEDEEPQEFIMIPERESDNHIPFHGNVPKLRRLALWGVHVDWSSLSLLSGPNIRSLMFAYHIPSHRPTFDQYANILRASPNLTSLNLVSSGPKQPSDFDGGLDTWPHPPIVLESLLVLSIGMSTPEYGIALINRLYTPNLVELSLDYEGADYTQLVMSLCKARDPPVRANDPPDEILPALSNAPNSMLINVQRLRIRGLPCDPEIIGLLWKSVPMLKELYVNFYYWYNSERCLKLLSSASASASAQEQKKVQLLCPLLKTVLITGASGREVREFVEERKNLGVPLRQVMMATDDELKEEDHQWLNENVELFGMFENSDDEDVDEDDEDDEDEDEDEEEGDDDDNGFDNENDDDMAYQLQGAIVYLDGVQIN